MNEFIEVLTKKYAQFSGRARRREFWMFVTINVALHVVIRIVESLSGLSFIEGDFAGGGYLSGLYSLVIIVPHLAVMVRRLHDTGRSGWVALVSLIPLINLILLVLLAEDSKPAGNKWGPNPKTPAGGNPVPVQNW